MLRAAEANPAYYFQLGDYLLKTDEDRAASYIELGYEKVADRVAASYRAEWLVRYFLKKNEREKARAVANEAGEVYSFSGLQAKATFHEQIGEFDEAFKWYKNIDERYNDVGPLVQFCERYRKQTGSNKFESAIAKYVQGVFPKGQETVTMASFKKAPRSGVSLAGENDLVRQAGLKQGDVIVALNGVRVDNVAQYTYLRDRLDGPEMQFIVWNGTAYVEASANLPDHRFHIDINTYKQK
jgi:hypothetical protein